MSYRYKVLQDKASFDRQVQTHKRQRTDVLLNMALALRMHHWLNTEEENIRLAAAAHVLEQRDQWPDEWPMPARVK